ncbi:hypothetical protein V6N11_037178 [Hibiscus sabdariffa]|uniref:Uncharacterized protein n=1 Tax=Hibiscus sabdariffa TaxID=183260 RepID=A0ABR2P0R2_9ROSI
MNGINRSVNGIKEGLREGEMRCSFHFSTSFITCSRGRDHFVNRFAANAIGLHRQELQSDPHGYKQKPGPMLLGISSMTVTESLLFLRLSPVTTGIKFDV